MSGPTKAELTERIERLKKNITDITETRRVDKLSYDRIESELERATAILRDRISEVCAKDTRLKGIRHACYTANRMHFPSGGDKHWCGRLLSHIEKMADGVEFSPYI